MVMILKWINYTTNFFFENPTRASNLFTWQWDLLLIFLGYFTIPNTLKMNDFSMPFFNVSGDRGLIERFIASSAMHRQTIPMKRQHMQTVAHFLAKLQCKKGFISFLEVNISFSDKIISMWKWGGRGRGKILYQCIYLILYILKPNLELFDCYFLWAESRFSCIVCAAHWQHVLRSTPRT